MIIIIAFEFTIGRTLDEFCNWRKYLVAPDDLLTLMDFVLGNILLWRIFFSCLYSSLEQDQGFLWFYLSFLGDYIIIAFELTIGRTMKEFLIEENRWWLKKNCRLEGNIALYYRFQLFAYIHVLVKLRPIYSVLWSGMEEHPKILKALN